MFHSYTVCSRSALLCVGHIPRLCVTAGRVFFQKGDTPFGIAARNGNKEFVRYVAANKYGIGGGGG